VKTKGPTTPQNSLGSSKMLASAQPKSHNIEKSKEKLRSSGRESHRPKTHDGPREGRREHRTSQRVHASRAGVSSDRLKAGPKEIPHEVVRYREQEAPLPSAGYAGVHPHREAVRRHSGSAGGQWPNPRHFEESRSKPAPSHNPPSVPHRMTGSDQRLLATHGGADAKSGSGVKGEKPSTKVECCKSCLI